MWVFVAVLAGLVAAFAMKCGVTGLHWNIVLGVPGSIVLTWIFPGRWVTATRPRVRSDRPSARLA